MKAWPTKYRVNRMANEHRKRGFVEGLSIGLAIAAIMTSLAVAAATYGPRMEAEHRNAAPTKEHTCR